MRQQGVSYKIGAGSTLSINFIDILNDRLSTAVGIHSGCIRFYTHPPESHGHVSARIVGDWGKAFEMVRLLICSYPMDSHDDIFVLDFFGKGRRRDRP
jgi:hypothetical protein